MIGSKSLAWFGVFTLTAIGLCACSEGASTTGAGGSGGAAVETTGSAMTGGGGAVASASSATTGGAAIRMLCAPGATRPCYDGPAASRGIGLCQDGVAACAADGQSWSACEGEVLPQAETCDSAGDDDCDGQTNEGGAGCACVPGSMSPCYSGPPETLGVGPCKGGMQACNAEGTGYEACVGEVSPQPETCSTPIDDNCDGQVNEGGDGCVCVPDSVAPCYSGPPGTQGVGVCAAGTKTCNAQGTAYGACSGEVLPEAAESCNTAVDDNCDGQVNEGCVVTYAGEIQPIFAAKCAPCHVAMKNGGANLAVSYADTQKPAYSCVGKTKGACSAVRVQNGTMPTGMVCSGSAGADAGKAACLTAAEQATLQAWIAGGQLP